MGVLTPDAASATIRTHRTLETATGSVVAPHIAWLLQGLFGDEDVALAQLAAGLSEDQLAGLELLPIAAVAAAAEVRPVDLEALSPSERRVLVFAALLTVDRAAVLIDATAVPTAVLLSERVRVELTVVDGRVRFLRPAAAAAIAAAVPEHERAAAHRALARAARSHGHLAAATWHSANADTEAGARTAPGLLEVADHQARWGGLDVAARIVQGATGEVPTHRSSATILAGRAALFAGHPGTAARLLESEQACASLELDTARRAALRAARTLATPAIDANDPHGVKGPTPTTAAMLGAFAELAYRRVDRTVLDQLALAAERWTTDPDEADELLARLAVSVPTSRPEAAREPEIGAPSPLVEAYLRLMQTRFLLRSGDRDTAAAIFLEGFARLPFTVAEPALSATLAFAVVDSVPESHRAIVEMHRATVATRRAAAFAPCSTAATAATAADQAGRRLITAARLLFGAGSSRELDDAWTLLLSRRERHVAELVADGLRNREIGDRLGISDRTVEVHLGRIYRKAGVSARGGLIAKLLR